MKKKKLTIALQSLSKVKKVYPSDANFILIEVENANDIYNDLVVKK